MSHGRANRENNKSNKIFSHYTKQQKLRRGTEFDNYHYNRPYSKFQYYSAKYNFQPRWSYRRRRPPPHASESRHSRSPSPFSGTEEYTMKKIQETSDMIKKRLMMPEDDVVDAPKTPPVSDEQPVETDTKSSKNESEKAAAKTNKKAIQYNVGEIHQKIITHITNLSHGKKMNLICANSSGYDVAIQQIHKQKRLELSKVLRDMCSNQTVESSEVINAIIPDIGIKIEDLPLEVIQELSSTLNLNFDDASCSQSAEGTVSVKTENVVTVEEGENEIIASSGDEESGVIDIDKIKQEINTDCEVKDDEVDFPMENSGFNSTSLSSLDGLSQTQENNCADMDDPSQIQQSHFPEIDGPNQIPENHFTNIWIKSENIDANTFITASVQTDSNELKSVSTQTDCPLVNKTNKFDIDKDKINSLDDAISAMLEIDKEITRLTIMRQSIFAKIQKKENSKNEKVTIKTKSKGKSPTKRTEITKNEKSSKQHKMVTRATANHETQKTTTETKNNSAEVTNDTNLTKEKLIYYEKPLKFESISEKILVIKVIENIVLAASEKGNVFYINALDGTVVTNIHVSELPIVSLCHWVTSKGKLLLLIGTANNKLHEYNYDTRELIRVTNIKDIIQCMEVAWFYIFIGTTAGNLIRYSLKQCKVEFKDKISDDNVMVLKAAQEGARRVLLVGMRNAPVFVRDAMSGLRLRTMTESVTPTVYSLILENSMVYCGTTAHDILVYSFHDGNLVRKYQVSNSKGISCLRVSGDLLFASCYNGNVYVYDIKTHKYVGSIEGPGGVILSMEVVKNIVIVGTMSLNFKSVLIPEYILKHSKI
ncbi:uncharacterized protein LOC135124351 [Zophobas morio]|uniref:uncharacterized protein LOC135124351 n=1 Tax=Zophobas morio TaxID=2755281 RepID=UPI003082EC96